VTSAATACKWISSPNSKSIRCHTAELEVNAIIHQIIDGSRHQTYIASVDSGGFLSNDYHLRGVFGRVDRRVGSVRGRAERGFRAGVEATGGRFSSLPLSAWLSNKGSSEMRRVAATRGRFTSFPLSVWLSNKVSSGMRRVSPVSG